MHICGAGCHVGKKNLHETGILHEILLENKRRNPAFSFPIWDSVLWETVRFQENLTLYLNTVMDSVTMDGDRIASILCRQETTEKEYVLSAPLFADATGNATLGYYAGAEFRTGSECAAEFGEPDAPETPNDHSMGNTILFMAADRGKPVPFTLVKRRAGAPAASARRCIAPASSAGSIGTSTRRRRPVFSRSATQLARDA